MDFVSDQLFDGRRFRVLAIVDNHTREGLALVPRQKIRGIDVVNVLDLITSVKGTPKRIKVDNGPEFTADVVRGWLGHLGVKTLFIEPGSPWENGYIESFNGKLRDELLKGEVFDTLLEAKVIVERWRKEYNTERSHSSLGYRLPAPEVILPVQANQLDLNEEKYQIQVGTP